ncbi:uncharacterized protein [Neodiprion pinetum]|uniref:uncharacterized protein n=1 Tax=Neodiprion pinetum TaxID=441929 RepID=UPI003720CA6D
MKRVDLDSDWTESGLDGEDQENDRDNRENTGKSPKSFSARSDKSSLPANSQRSENENSTDCRSARSSQSQYCYRKRDDDPDPSWEVNFDFIQGIIWLKATLSKLQRVPADEFSKVFKNLWRLSEKIRFSQQASDTSPPVLAASEIRSSATFRKPLNLDERQTRPRNTNSYDRVDFSDTKQRAQLQELKNRLCIGYKTSAESQEDFVVPDSDESPPVSPVATNLHRKPDRATAAVPVSEWMDSSSTVDSGFNSEKPESADSANVYQIITNGESTRLEKLKSSRPIFKGTSDSDYVPSSTKIDKSLRKRKRADSAPASKRPRLFVSSATLSYVLRSSECNQLLVRSVRLILKVLANEKIVSSFRSWHASVQKEGIEAIVSIVELLDKEKGLNSCRREVVKTIVKILTRMLHSDHLDKTTIWEHHRLIILELCNASSVCTQVISYLISELKKLVLVVTEISEENVLSALDLHDKSYVIFHSLDVILRKYKSVALGSLADERMSAPEKIPEVTNLWKRHWRVNEKEPDIFLTGLKKLEVVEDQEKDWTRVLEELVVSTTQHWPLVKVMAWQCLSLLKSKIDNLSTGDGSKFETEIK